MLPSLVEIRHVPGRPSEAVLHFACGIRIAGIRVWRTPRGPRVVMPALRSGRGPCFALPPSLRRECEAAVLARWRACAVMTESVNSLARAAA